MGMIINHERNKWILAIVVFVWFVMPSASHATVSPLLSTSWHQQSPYNLQCPMTTVGGSTHSAAGCGAIAVSQILTKYKKPIHGFGHSYYENTSSGIMTDVDYSALTMEWDKVQNSYISTYMGTESEDAVASIVYQVGAAMQMSYGTSSAPKNMGQMMWGLQHYLHMSPQCRYRNRIFYSTNEWLEMLRCELANGRPVYYKGEWLFAEQSAAHIFVIDGISADGKYHVNFGHGASHNMYVDLNVLNYTQNYAFPGGRTVCYNVGQSMITDFYPVDGLSDSDYSAHSLILSSNIHFSDDMKAERKVMALGGTLRLKMDIRDCSLVGGATPFGLGIYKNGQLLQVLRDASRPNVTFSMGGLVGTRTASLTMPTGLANGDYELRLVSSPDEGQTWEAIWDNAPNVMNMNVNNGVVTILLHHDYTGETRLYLRDQVCRVNNYYQNVTNGVKGEAFKVALRNPTENNFENLIRMTFTVQGTEQVYDVKTSVYGGCDVDYVILVPTSSIDLEGKSYSVKVSYYEKNLGEYIELSTSPTVGDVDEDGKVSISDVTSLIDYLLGNGIDVEISQADCNFDGRISIDDLTCLIDMLLRGRF